MSDPMVIARRLRAYRRDRGYTQETFAGAMGLSRGTVAAIEDGARRLTADEMLRAMQALGATLDDLTDPYRLDPGEGRWTFRLTPEQSGS